MTRYRGNTWFSLMSVLLLAVFVQAQAAGCCKLGFRFQRPVDAAVASSAEAASLPQSNPMDHACCPKKAAADEAQADGAPLPFAAHSVQSGEHACCLAGAELNVASLASVHSESPLVAALPVFARVAGLVLPQRDIAYPSSALLDSGPPESHSNLPLLI
jgi:hypothetical protein